MKKHLLLAITGLSLFTTACKKDDNDSPAPSPANTFTMKVDGVNWSSQPGTLYEQQNPAAYVFGISPDSDQVIITAFKVVSGDTTAITLGVVAPKGKYTGTYAFTPLGNNMATYGNVSGSGAPAVQGTVTISAYDASAKTFTGTFNGTFMDTAANKNYVITNGVFNKVKVIDINLPTTDDFTMKVNGTQWKASGAGMGYEGPTATYTVDNGMVTLNIAGLYLNVGSTATGSAITFTLNTDLNSVVGTHDMSELASLYVTGTSNYAAGTTGSMTITKFDTTTGQFSATFNGTYTALTGSTTTITDGKITNIKLVQQ